jgi:beta-lactamase regulating signal transducer with metallopeptidase domain
MTLLSDEWVISLLARLADWSLRWGAAIAILAAWLVLRPPRSAATRYLICLAALLAGLLLPLTPRWGDVAVSWPFWAAPAGSRETTGAIALAPRAADPGPIQLAPTVPSLATPLQNAAPRGLVPSAALPSGVWRLLALAAAGAWAAVVVALLVRLAAGWLMLARLTREALGMRSEGDRLLGECRAALKLSRAVQVAEHPAVASPVVVGGLRPVVLVPTDWGDWPESHRRACLLHELAHLARYDDWAKFAEEFVRSAFFFHPLVRWLLARLDREREILCDEATVALGCDPVVYARLLFDLVRRPVRLYSVMPSIQTGWLPFLDRRTVAVRIKRLLEADMPRTLSRPSVYRLSLVGSLTLAATLGIGGLRLRAVEQQPDKGSQPAITPVRAESATQPARTIRGVILDAEGKPVGDAIVVAGFPDLAQPNHQVFKTDQNGRFTWSILEGPISVYFIAHREGLAPGIWMTWLTAEQSGERVERKLRKSESFSAVLVDGSGRPMAGARVRIEMFGYAGMSPRDASGRTTTFTAVEYVRRQVIDGSPLAALFETTTDRNGAFEIGAPGPDTWLKLSVSAPGGSLMRVKAAKVAQGLVATQMTDAGFVTAPAGETARLVAVPTARVAGRVVTKLPGVRVSGLMASYQESHAPGAYRPTSNFGATVWTDADGRFAFDGLSAGTINVVGGGDGENKDWTYRAAKDVNLVPGATSEVTLELIRGVDVEGTVVAQGTGAPLAGAQVGVHGPCRPRTSAMIMTVTTDARGRYRFRLPSGESYFYISGPPSGYTRLSGEGSSRTVTIPDGATSHTVPPIELAAAVTVRGHVLDASGAPIAGATVVGICEGGVCRPFGGGETVTDHRGEFRLPPGLYNTVAIGKPARLLVRLPVGAEHEVAAVPTEGGSVTIKLPGASVAH